MAFRLTALNSSGGVHPSGLSCGCCRPTELLFCFVIFCQSLWLDLSAVGRSGNPDRRYTSLSLGIAPCHC